MSVSHPTPLDVAQTAFHDFEHGLAQGDWSRFLDRLSDDFSFWFPAGPFQGMNHGKEQATAFFQSVTQVFPRGLTLKVERIFTHEATVLFEVRSEGLVGETLYQNQAAISFDVRGNQICAYREYLGVIFRFGNNT